MRRLDINDPEYLKQLRELENVWRISASIRTVDKDLQLSELVRLELGFLVSELRHAIDISELAYKWSRERNPYLVDLIVIVCNRLGIEPPPSLLRVITEAATLRFNGDPAGTSAQIKKESALSHTYNLMLNLIYHGATLADAASKAADWKKNWYGHLRQTKASTLQKNYQRIFIDTNRQQARFDIWNRHESIGAEDEGVREAWIKLAESLPKADADLTGVRNR
jgi:hypothetical protein